MSEDFNWHSLSCDDVVIPPAQAVAVYISDAGYLIIRQEGLNGEGDTIITINPQDMERFALAVQNSSSE